MISQIVQNSATGADRGRAVPQPKTVQGKNLEMVPQSKLGRFDGEDPIFVPVQNRKTSRQRGAQAGSFAGKNDFRRAQALQLREKGSFRWSLSATKIAGSEIHA